MTTLAAIYLFGAFIVLCALIAYGIAAKKPKMEMIIVPLAGALIWPIALGVVIGLYAAQKEKNP